MGASLNSVFENIDQINQLDPNLETIDGQSIPKELLYGQRMSECLNQYWPDADEYVQIAVRAQHIKRWHIKRSEYPEGRKGYHQWRRNLGKFHAELAVEIMQAHGYNEQAIAETASIIRKEDLKSNPKTQTLEDVACLVFLSYYFEPFAAKHSDEKIIAIVQKTWGKMSDKARGIALSLTLPLHLSKLVEQALAG